MLPASPPAWMIAPAPAVFLPAAGAPLPNPAARAWSHARSWSGDDWQRVTEAIAAVPSDAAAPRRGQLPQLGLGWQYGDCDGGLLAWLYQAAPTGAPDPRAPLLATAAAVGAAIGPAFEPADGSGADPLRTDPTAWSRRLDVSQELGRFGLWERDPLSGAAWWDVRAASLFGLDRAAQQGGPAFSDAAACIHPADLERVRAAYRASLQQPGDHECHYRVRLAGGADRRVHSRWRVASAGAAGPQPVVGILVDESERLDALERQQLSAQQLVLATGLVGITLWRIDLASGRVQLDDKGHEFSGIPRDPLGVPLQDLRDTIHPDDRAAVQDAAERALLGEAIVDVRARYRDRDGHYRDMLTRRLAQRDEQGRVTALLGAAMDMTQQQAERARSAAVAARMDLVAEATGIGVWSRKLDSKERDWNGQMRRIFDLPAGQPAPSLRELLLRRVVADDRPKVTALSRKLGRLVTQARAAGPPASGARPAAANPLLEVQLRIQNPADGLRWLVARAQVLWQGDELIAHGAVIDVTASHAARQELELAQRRIELAALAAGLGTWELDLHNDAHHWDAQMYILRGLRPDDPRPIPTLIRSLPPPEDDPQVDARVAEALRGDGSYRNEFRVCWPDGSVHWLASRGMTVAGPDGRRSRLIGVNWDITEQKQAEQMLRDKLKAEEASRARGEFLARMSHELRTPLNAVIGFSELLCEASVERIGAQERAHAELIRSAGRHLLALIDDVLDLARIDAAKLPLASEPVALDAVLGDVVRWVQPEASAAGVQVRASASGRWVRGDARSLRQVFANLLSNGVKYNQPGGQVQVSVGAPGLAPAGARFAPPPAPPPLGWTVVLVRDTGRGFSEAQLDHVFEAFNRLGAEGGEIRGTGIGLAIVQQLVTRMAGHVEVHSAPGQGCEFRLWLPSEAAPASIGKADPVPAAPGPQRSAVPAGTGTAAAAAAALPLHSALYIEDNPVNLVLVQELFACRPAWRLHCAGNGADGIEAALGLRPQLALIDMQLPDMDGLQVLARLRAEPALQGMRCIALSANAMPEDIALARAAGFDDYWTKPVDFAGFLAALDSLAIDACNAADSA